MPSNIVPSNFTDLSKEFKTDDDGKCSVSWRGLGRMCGVKHNSWGQASSKKSGSQKALVIAEPIAESKLLVGVDNSKRSGVFFTLEIDQYLADGDLDCGALEKGQSIPDIYAAEVIRFYAEEKQNPVAKKYSRAFGAIGIRAFGQQLTGYKPSLKRKLTAEEIIEICCLPVPTTWERRFPEEYYEHLSRLTGLVVDGHTRPCYWAALTKELVYSYLPEGIYSEIKRCKDESGNWDKLHQYLSADGVEILEAHQRKVLHHMQGAASINQLRTALKQACTGQYQLVLL